MSRRKIIPYNPNLKQLARQLRNDSTKAEIFMWKMLKGKQLYGYDFHRQKPIDNYIVDFFCNELMLAIELDGYSHIFPDVHQKDKEKEKKLNQLGVTVLHFWDDEIFRDTDNVFRVIEDYISRYEETHPRPLSRGESNL
ncbi:endonuclease domain-containing protein [Maribellus maritimus]|uniref:endonuclease domain-containing protein n=1 Tax=Maribellus maritimus TaxID=2870838 RepID=UPI001EECC466|nr:endonuclease domain-containing protein [Maribellus maritimus]MCG6191232.1 endonuclease domain-containing protein [Maribellus maritimus]